MNINSYLNYIKTIPYLFLLLVITNTSIISKDKKTITFKADDGLEITADLYIEHELTKPFIVLFHQAGWSRGEYLEIAPRLNRMGYNCMAVDQRSGDSVNTVENQTYREALKEKKDTDYLSAYVDLESAVKFVKTNYAKGKIIVWGSSYSASLVLKLAAELPGLVSGVLAFSPGEYFTSLGKNDTFISYSAMKIECPVFIASAKNEKENWDAIYNAIPGDHKTFFIPADSGHHGSSALWLKYFDSGSYWLAVKKFLRQFSVQNYKGKNNGESN